MNEAAQNRTCLYAVIRIPVIVHKVCHEQRAYFRFVRDLRKQIPNVRAMNETSDVGTLAAVGEQQELFSHKISYNIAERIGKVPVFLIGLHGDFILDLCFEDCPILICHIGLC